MDTLELDRFIEDAIRQGLPSINLADREIEELPRSIAHFGGRGLDLSGNRLKTLPPEIGQLTNLTGLYLRGNDGLALPREIGNMAGLKYLDISAIGLTETPEQIGRLRALEQLDVSGNKLTALPPWIAGLTELTALDISGNQLTELPEFVVRLPQLRDLYAGDNPWVTPPKEIVAEGIDAIRNYYRQAAAEGFDYLYEAKLIIVGEPGAGKTTLAKKIIEPAYQAVREESTHGIRVDRWQFDQEGRPFYANIWDFGGQEIYLATHRFFLTESSCYVLVAQERREDPHFQYWLQFVQLLGKDSPLIILRNMVDGRVKEIPRELLAKFSCYREPQLTIDLKHDGGEFETKVVRPIKFHLSSLQHIGARLPKPWPQVRNALEDDPRDHIPYGEFERICRANGFSDDDDIANLCRYFHNIGVCLHYADDPLLNHTVVLKPEWATRAVYSILATEGLVQQNNGRFVAADVSTILDAKYRRMRDEIIELMVKFEIVYPVPGAKTYIAPQLLPLNKPDYPWDLSDNRMLRYTFREFMPMGLLWRFIVAMHKDIERHELVWRGGVVLLIDETRAEVIEDYPKEIRVRVQGRHKRDLITRIDHEFGKVFGLYYDKLPYNTQIPCNCAECRESAEPYFFRHKVLRNAIDKGEQVVQCQDSFLWVNPRALLDDVLDEQALSRLRANEAAGRVPESRGGVTVQVIQHNEEHTRMGDNYTQGQGFQGPGMKVHDNQITFQQVWNQVGQDMDFDKLTEQLGAVRRAVKALPESKENDRALGPLADAEDAAEKKDGPGVLGFLKSAGSVALEAAKSVGADVLTRLIEHAMGMPPGG